MAAVCDADDGSVEQFEDPHNVQWFAGSVTARRREIARDQARGRPQLIFDADWRTGEVPWEAWLSGFADAMALRPEA